MTQTPPFQIFISHRHNDARIANTIYDTMVKWGVPTDCIYSTSKIGKSDPGAPLTAALANQIKHSDLFILVFTLADEDWSYCMWELGVAMGVDTKPTKIVVFKCHDAEPHVRTERLMVNPRDETSLGTFVTKFFKDPDWVVPDTKTRTGAMGTLRKFQGRDDEFVKDSTLELIASLAAVLPEGEAQELQRLDFISLSLAKDHADEVRQLRHTAEVARAQGRAPGSNREEGDRRHRQFREEAHTVLKENLYVLPKSNVSGLQRFGKQRYEPGMTLGDLIGFWNRDFEELHGDTDDDRFHGWKHELLSDLSRATELRQSRVAEFFMPSLSHDDKRMFQPVVVRSRTLPDGGMEYDINFLLVKQPTNGERAALQNGQG